MAFKDITKVFYDGSIKLDYKDKAHRYYVRDRIDWELPKDDPKAWSKVRYPKGTTTLLDETLEKKGLMTWPMGMALRELFGFYNFKTDEGEQKIGFSKEKEVVDGKVVETGNLVGTMWRTAGNTHSFTKDELLPIVKSASENYLRKQKKGADIGSVVHDAIEHYVLANPNLPEPVLDEKGEPTGKSEIPAIRGSGFDIGQQYMWNIKEADYETEVARDQAMADFEGDVKQASAAFEQFTAWWNTARPVLVGTEELVYSKEHNIAGTYDGLIRIDGKLVLCDWKTSNASTSKAAASPEGVYYSYMIQSAIYALAHMEMGGDAIEDLLIVSARKDGGFSLVYASELGLSMADLLDWAKAVITCFQFIVKTKAALLAHAPVPESKEDSEDV